MKRGSKPEFNELGSSPVKQKPENFNWKGGPTTTPGYESTKAAKAKTTTGKAKSTTKTTTLPGGHHHRVTTGPEAMRPPKDAIVKKAVKSKQGKLGKIKTKKVYKKGAKKILKKIGSKFLPGVGVGLGIADAISIAGHTKDEGSLKKGLKKWWDDPGHTLGMVPNRPKSVDKIRKDAKKLFKR